MRSLVIAIPDIRPYDALPLAVPRALNTADIPGAAESAKMDFSRPARILDTALNRVLWSRLKREPWPPKTARFSSDPDD